MRTWRAGRLSTSAGSRTLRKNLQLQRATNATVWVHGSSNIRIEACTLRNSRSHAVAADGVSPGLTVYNNHYSEDSNFHMTGSFVNIHSTVDSVNVSYNTIAFSGLGTRTGLCP